MTLAHRNHHTDQALTLEPSLPKLNKRVRLQSVCKLDAPVARWSFSRFQKDINENTPLRCPTSTDRIIDANSMAKPRHDVRYNQTCPDKPEESSYLRSRDDLDPQKQVPSGLLSLQQRASAALFRHTPIVE
jgi:hypothetical protein